MLVVLLKAIRLEKSSNKILSLDEDQVCHHLRSSTLFFVDFSLGRQLKSNKQLLDTAYSSLAAFQAFHTEYVCKYSLEVSWEQIELCPGTTGTI